MSKSYDSQEVFVAIVFETNDHEAQKTVYAGHDENLAVEAIQNTHPGNYDFAKVERWKDGERKFTKEYSLSQRVEVTPL
jgi:hypothetical protein